MTASISLTYLFGHSPRVELLEVLATYSEDDVTIPFLAEHSRMSIATAYKYMERLEREGLVIRTTKKGATQYYTLNLENEQATLIAHIHNTYLARAMAEQLHCRGLRTLEEEKAREVEAPARAKATGAKTAMVDAVKA